MKTVEYKKELPTNLVLGRNKFADNNGKIVRVVVKLIQLGGTNPEKIAELKSIEKMKKEDVDALKPEDKVDYKKKKDLLSSLLSVFKDEETLKNGFVGYKITRYER